MTLINPSTSSDDGWIEWTGGECPVAPEALVRVRYRTGREKALASPARAFRWSWVARKIPSIRDIIAYRCHATPEAQDFDDYEDAEIGCVNCDAGWRHGCCDDLCRGSNEPQDCDYARKCLVCNKYGEVL